MLRLLLGAVIGLAVLLALQTYRLDRCHLKAKQMETCQEVNELERDAQDDTDDDLVNSISQR